MNMYTIFYSHLVHNQSEQEASCQLEAIANSIYLGLVETNIEYIECVPSPRKAFSVIENFKHTKTLYSYFVASRNRMLMRKSGYTEKSTC
jgi:hypothetical protein